MLEIIIFTLIILIFGVFPSYWYLKKRKEPSSNRPNIVVVILATLLMLFDIYFAFFLGEGSIFFVVGYVFMMPMVLIALFSLSKSGRNWRTRWNILLFTSFITALSVFGNLISLE